MTLIYMNNLSEPHYSLYVSGLASLSEAAVKGDGSSQETLAGCCS